MDVLGWIYGLTFAFNLIRYCSTLTSGNSNFFKCRILGSVRLLSYLRYTDFIIIVLTQKMKGKSACCTFISRVWLLFQKQNLFQFIFIPPLKPNGHYLAQYTLFLTSWNTLNSTNTVKNFEIHWTDLLYDKDFFYFVE